MASHPALHDAFAPTAYEPEDAQFGPRAPVIDLRFIAAVVRANLLLIAAIIATCLAIALVSFVVVSLMYRRPVGAVNLA